MIDHAPELLAANMHVRVELDIDISYEEANFIKDTFVKDYNLTTFHVFLRINVFKIVRIAPRLQEKIRNCDMIQ